MITVEKIDDNNYKVTVDSESKTTHDVTLSPSYYKKLTHEKVSPEALIKKSFEFLLKREPNTSILSAFDLTVINQYFPEYERIIQKM
jgi:hypothetical protein